MNEKHGAVEVFFPPIAGLRIQKELNRYNTFKRDQWKLAK